MKQKLTLSLLLLLVTMGMLHAQTTINVQVAAGVFTVTPVPTVADFSQKVTIICASAPANFAVKKKTDNISDPAKQADGSYTLTVNKPKAASFKVTLSATGVKDLTLEVKNVAGGPPPKGGSTEAAKVFANLAPYQNFYRYNRKEDRAYFFFDQNGKLMGPAPVNIDADDYIEVFIAVPESTKADYSVEMLGEYNASDLNIRPYEPIAQGAAQGTAEAGEQFTYIHEIFGPFTSSKATIRIYGKDSADEGVLLNQVDVKINKLYNVAIGASFVSTSLANPDFDVFPINGSANQTIKALNEGKRTMVSFNVIYYWKPTIDWVVGKLSGSSHITRGRDILKEPTFWERLNPTFGVALSDKWRENFFLGGNFEFARGGSVSAGWHYGKVQSLANDKFKLGEDLFTGTKNDIKLTNSWKWSTFVAVTVDTRIFNLLFKHN